MKTEVPLEKVIGKTIIGYEISSWCPQMVIAFTDSTFTTLRASSLYGDLTFEGDELDWSDFGDERLLSLGIVTRTELLDHKKEIELRRQKWAEEVERKRYEELRAKYENRQQQDSPLRKGKDGSL